MKPSPYVNISAYEKDVQFNTDINCECERSAEGFIDKKFMIGIMSANCRLCALVLCIYFIFM